MLTSCNKVLPLILLLAFAVGAIVAQPKHDFSRAERLLKLDATAAKQEIESLTSEEAASLVSQIRMLSSGRNPDLDKVYYLLEHTERIKASALAQKRLNNLLVVLGATLALFAGYLTYLNIDQRRMIKRLEVISADTEATGPPAPGPVFRGDA